LISYAWEETNAGAVGALLFVIDNFSSKILSGLSLFTAAKFGYLFCASKNNPLLATEFTLFVRKTIPEFGFEKTFTFAEA
jgi:hypothetical protein